jgi:hypothetical protein
VFRLLNLSYKLRSKKSKAISILRIELTLSCSVLSMLTYQSQSLRLTVSQNVLVSSPLCGRLTRHCFLFKSLGLEFVVLSLWGALSDLSALCNHSRSRSYFTTDGRSVSMSWRRAPPLGPMTRFYFFFALLFVLGWPLWREDGSVICSAICQWLESELLTHLRLLGSLSVASYDSQGLRWKCSYPPPHGEGEISSPTSTTRCWCDVTCYGSN